MATTSTGVFSQTIIDTMLADVNAVVPNFATLVSSYRLLVGAAEEIHRIPGASPDVFARSIERFDRTGVLIDILIDLLCCKVAFSSDLLAVTGAPVDLFRLLANRLDVADAPHVVADEILILEILRKAEQALKGSDSAAPPPCTPPGPPPYTFATSFYQPPPPPPAAFPPHVPPAQWSPPPQNEQPQQEATESAAKASPATGSAAGGAARAQNFVERNSPPSQPIRPNQPLNTAPRTNPMSCRPRSLK